MLTAIAMSMFGAMLLEGGGDDSGAAVQVGYSTDGSEHTRAEFQTYLNALAKNNAAWFARHPEAECCVTCAGIRYVPPEKCGPQCQKLQNAAQLLADGQGTCGPIAAYNVGVMLNEGRDAWVQVVHQGENTPYKYHAIVAERLADGSIEYTDPTEEMRQ